MAGTMAGEGEVAAVWGVEGKGRGSLCHLPRGGHVQLADGSDLSYVERKEEKHFP